MTLKRDRKKKGFIRSCCFSFLYFDRFTEIQLPALQMSEVQNPSSDIRVPPWDHHTINSVSTPLTPEASWPALVPSCPLALPCPALLCLSRKSLICFLSLLISSHFLEFYTSGITQYVLFSGSFWNLSTLLCVSAAVPNSLYGYSTVTYSLYLKDSWAVPSSWLLQTKLPEHSYVSLCMDMSLHFS